MVTTTKRKIVPRMPGFHFQVRLPEKFNEWLADYLKKSGEYPTPAELVRELLIGLQNKSTAEDAGKHSAAEPQPTV